MDLRGWESLWKIFATIGITNLLLFFCYRICKRDIQFSIHLHPDCY